MLGSVKIDYVLDTKIRVEIFTLKKYYKFFKNVVNSLVSRN